MVQKNIQKDLQSLLSDVQDSIELVNEYTLKEYINILESGNGVGLTPDLLSLPRAIGRFFLRFSESCKKEVAEHQEKGVEIQKALDVLDSEIIEKRSNTNWTSLAPGVEAYPKPELKIKRTVLDAICPALQSITGDSFEIAKITTPVLLSLSLAGTINIPSSPLVFGLFAVLLSKAGVESICRNIKKD